ncbi:3-oxoacyl-[acyl-carrier-protein] synthase 3 [Clostridia bacterium]|nr:3-oxoacyl-[acyl-carrier-protein] synthase 3 [Clostridia bacterium]
MFRIKNTGVYLPETILDNEYFTKIVDTNCEWIETRTGIKERRKSNVPTHILATKAAKEAMSGATVYGKDHSNITPEDIDLIIVSSVTPDYWFPSVSCLVAREIGAKNAACFDISVACAGFNYILDIASKQKFNYALVIGSEVLTKLVDYTDRSTCVLFGDGAGAFLLEGQKVYENFMAKYNKNSILSDQHNFLYGSHLGAEGDGAMCIHNEHTVSGIKQDGKEVYKFATKILPLAIGKAVEDAGITLDQVDWFIPHQANLRIIETGAKNLGISLDKFIITIEKYGNTSSSSIPIAFNDGVKSGKIKRGDTVCLVGFGSGLVYGGNVFVY